MTRPLPARLRLRRRLLIGSAPPAVVAALFAVKLISVVVAGDSAQRHFAAGDIGALGDDVSVLRVLNVIEPANADVAAGGLAVLEDRLDAADAHFTEALGRSDASRSCAVRVNLELVRERQGDIDAWEARLETARERYESALRVIAEAPVGCFEDNTDPDLDRQKVRADAATRVAAKISTLGTVTPPGAAPAPPPPPATPPPGAPVVAPPDLADSPETRRLDPADGDPLDAIRRLLRDAASG